MKNEVLNDKVINTIDNNVAVSAGAGSGKTHSLTNRFIYILKFSKEKLNISNIIAITFTRMAALEMRERVRNFLREEIKTTPELQEYLDDFDRNQILTMDSLQGRILRSHPVEAGLDPNFAVWEGEEYDILINNLTRRFLRKLAAQKNEDLELLLKYFDLNILYSYLEKAKKEKKILEYDDEKLLEPYTEIKEEVAAFIRTARTYCNFINDELTKENILGHDDVTNHCIKLLKENDKVRHLYQKQIKYLMVDEFQDTNDAQRELIYLLCGDDGNGEKLSGKKLFIVGDTKQSIYKFRGADVAVFKEVQDAILQKKGEIFTRTINRRSTDKILNFVNTVFDNPILFGNDDFVKLEPTEEHISTPEQNFETPVFKIFFPKDPKDKEMKKQLLLWEADAVAERIEYLIKSGAKYGDIAILLSKMTKVSLITKTLSQHGIPYVQLGGRGFYKKQEIYDMLNIFSIIYQDNLLSLIGVLRSPYFGLSDKDINELILSYKKPSEKKYSEKQNEELCRKILQDKICLPLLKLRNAGKHLGIAELWQKIFDEFEAEKILLAQKKGKQLLANIEKLWILSVEYSEKNKCGLKKWLEFVKDAIQKSDETEANLPSDGMIKIMTIHKSKGLGFDHVILPFLAKNKGRANNISFAIDTKEGILGIKIPNTDDVSVWEKIKVTEEALEHEEEKRKLYVATTRAKKTLYMSACITKIEKIEEKKDFAALLWQSVHDKFEIPPTGRQRKPRIGWKLKPNIVNLQKITVENFPTNEVKKENLKIATDIPSLFIKNNIICNVPQIIVFSPSMLQIYLHCQREYFYRYICRLPEYTEKNNEQNQNTIPASLQGSIIHTALEYYHGNNDKAFATALKLCNAENLNTENTRTIYNNYIESNLFKTIPENQLREISFQLPLEDGIAFKGIIDCLYLQNNGTYGIIDYKTGTMPQKLNEGYAMQLAIYSKAVQKMFKKDIGKLALHYLKPLKEIIIDDNEKIYDKAIILAKEMQEKNAENDFANNGSCDHCAYRYLCTGSRMQQEG